MKKITAILAVFAMFLSLSPSVFADDLTNEAFVGYYLSAGATDDNFGSLEILKCTDTSVTVNFRFIKNGAEQLVYTCSEGTMTGDEGTVPFTVHYQDGRFVSNGTMTISLDEWCVKISCDSVQGQHLFDGTMKPQFNLDPYADVISNNTSDVATPSSDVSVMLNGVDIVFPQGVSPYIINNYTYVPLRSVFDQMGINVYWDQYQKNDILSAQTITCTKDNAILQFSRTFNEYGYNSWSLSKWENSTTNNTDYHYIDISELQPVLIGELSYVPLRVISEAFGAVVDWEGITRTVIIACDTSNSYKYDSTIIANMEDFSLDIARSYITDDYTSIVQYNTPYFAPECKFYLFDAKDQWGDVTLRINYGGYIDVIPKVAEPVYESFELPLEVSSDSTEATEELVEETSEEVTESTLEDTLIDEY